MKLRTYKKRQSRDIHYCILHWKRGNAWACKHPYKYNWRRTLPGAANRKRPAIRERPYHPKLCNIINRRTQHQELVQVLEVV